MIDVNELEVIVESQKMVLDWLQQLHLSQDSFTRDLPSTPVHIKAVGILAQVIITYHVKIAATERLLQKKLSASHPVGGTEWHCGSCGETTIPVIDGLGAKNIRCRGCNTPLRD